ncbi:MAG TPA: chemotaxis protein CheW [Actinomycetes bacterium]|nr:chemotaxis protein CheW [Actinomycetes bacterium]
MESLASQPEAVEGVAEEEADPIDGVILRFAGARYAVDMSSVAEVVPVPLLTRVPGAPNWLSGVVNWRGRVLPVIDLRPLVGANLSPLPTSARLVVLSEDDIEVGVVADMVPGLLNCDPSQLEVVPATISTGIAPLVRGVVDVDGPVALLATDAVLRLRDQLPTARRIAG